ncbi:sulfatase [Lacibacter sp.]|uniref:sulfatase n=1 Tax=Lacibacter sp. TaxID=1915409 RepID=UPI002B4B003B|nr:sulfatase [Lacibacter sp.]HLP37611.1 sulfatase [Lacibacter sp.]
MAQQRPNVLIIQLDDMNGFGATDYYPKVKTPFLQKLKQEALNFIKATCQAPVCVPSRASMFSGLYPHTTGAYLNGSDPWRGKSILRNTESFPETFHKSGYETWARGKIFHAKVDSGRYEKMFDNRPIYMGGFGPFAEKEYWLGNGQFSSVKAWTGPDSDFPDIVNADAAVKFLEDKHDKPFFLFYGLWRPHTPYTAPKRFFDLYEGMHFELPQGYKDGDLNDVPFLARELVDSLKQFGKSQEEILQTVEKLIRGYCATSSFADWNMGRVIEALDKSPYAANTIVIVCSDNGYHNGEKIRWQKGTMWEMSAYTPLLIRFPGCKPQVINQTVGLIDLYPTLVEYCKLNKPPHKLEGQSMVLIFTNGNASFRSYSLTTYGTGYTSVTDGRYRYIRYPDKTEELYDHTTDPWEWNNIASQKNMNGVKKKLQKLVPKKMRESLGGRYEQRRGKDNKYMAENEKDGPVGEGNN